MSGSWQGEEHFLCLLLPFSATMANVTARLTDLSGPWVKQEVNLGTADGHHGLCPYPTLLTRRGFLSGFPGYTERKMKTSPLSKGKDPAVRLFSALCCNCHQVSSNVEHHGLSCIVPFPRWQGMPVALRSPASPGLSPPGLGGSGARKPMDAASWGGS